jgi:hypothetical protein
MRNLFAIIFLILLATNGHSQPPHKSAAHSQNECDTSKITFVDSLGKEINSNQTKFAYNGFKIIYLDQLHYGELKHSIGAYPGESNLSDSTGKYCVRCQEQAIKIVDSIDIDEDGVKELFLQREWYCSATPGNIGPYGEGGQQLELSKYEVWDVKAKTKIFEIKNSLSNQMAVSTSVVKSSSWKIDVKVDKSGSLILSNVTNGIRNIPELGTYHYDKKKRAYKKE